MNEILAGLALIGGALSSTGDRRDVPPGASQIAYHCGSKPPSQNFYDFRKYLRSGEGMGILGPGIYFASNYDVAKRYCRHVKKPFLYKVEINATDFYDYGFNRNPHVLQRLQAAVKEAGFNYSDHLETGDSLRYGRGWIGYLNKKLGTDRALDLLLKHGVRGQIEWIHWFWELAVFDPRVIRVISWERGPAAQPND